MGFMQGLYKQMVDILKGLGVDAVPTVGSPFDPALHDAIMREPNDEVADGTVLQEFRKGFRMGERLLRPAMVKVSCNSKVPWLHCFYLLYLVCLDYLIHPLVGAMRAVMSPACYCRDL